MASPWTKLCLLGRGAMGTVHLVEDARGARVARKYPAPEVAEAVLAAHRDLSAFTHPNVIRVLAVEADEDGPYVALEHVEGLSFGDVIRAAAAFDEAIPIGVALRVLEQAADGLAALHAWGDGGFLHRDLSPSNLLVGADGRVRIGDLDTAAPRVGNAARPIVSTRGKSGYAAPEQLADEVLDDRADVFALGATIGEALVGTPIFADDDRGEEAFMRAVDLFADRDDVPPGLLELLFEMLAALPAHRPSAADVRGRARALFSEVEGPDVAAYVASLAADAPAPLVRPPFRTQPHAGGVWQIKGVAVAATIDYLIQNFGEAAYGRVVDHVSLRTGETLSDPIDADAWYDGRTVVELTEAAQYLFGGSSSVARAIGAWSADRALSAGGSYQIFRDKGLQRGVAAFIHATEHLYGLYYARGEWTVERIDDRSARCRLRGVSYPPAVIERMVGYLARGLELIGAARGEVTSAPDGDDIAIDVSWAPSDASTVTQ